MFKLRALHADIDGLRLRGLQLRLRLHNICACGYADIILVFRKLQRTLIFGHRIVEQALLRIGHAQLHIIGRQFRLGA